MNKEQSKMIVKTLAEGVRFGTLSKYAQFTLLCLGYKFYYKGSDSIIYKWELFELGYININKLLGGEYPINAVKRN